MKNIDMDTVISLKDFKVLGYTTDFNKCDCCGKENLKGTISILDINNDSIMHYGSTCASAADKYDTLDAVKKAKKEINSAIRQYQQTIQSARSFAWRYIRKVYGNQSTGGTLDKSIWEPIVDDFENFYINNKGCRHPLFSTL